MLIIPTIPIGINELVRINLRDKKTRIFNKTRKGEK